LEVEVFFAKAKLAQTEERILGPFVGQRIDASDRVPERAIGVNESVYPRLERPFMNFACRRRGSARRTVAIIQIAQLEPFEKCRPAGIERLRILLPTPVIFLEQIEVYPGGKRWAHDACNLQGIRGPGKLTVPTALRYLAAPR
jgi:hypothetical protein